MDYTLMLTKLGEALYLHAREREEALLAKEAVDYLDEMGVFATEQQA